MLDAKEAPVPRGASDHTIGVRYRPPAERELSIDGLRGVAALAVAWFHMFTQNGAALTSEVMPHAFNVISVWGRFGVQLFFAISGFVIAYTLLPDRRMNSAVDMARYFGRRSLRLDPVYWCALAAYAIGIPVLLDISTELSTVYPQRTTSLPEILQQVLYFLPINFPYYAPVAWTLAIEVQFYVLFSLLVVLLNRADRSEFSRHATFVVVGALLIAVSFVNLSGVLRPSGHWLYHHMHTFLGGIFLAAMKLQWRHATLLFAANCVSMAVAFGLFRVTDVAASFLSSLLLFMAVYWSPLRYMLSGPLLLGLGALSYGVYLFHQLLGGLTIEILQRYVSDTAGFHQVAFVFFGILTTLGASAIVYNALEKRSIAWSKRL